MVRREMEKGRGEVGGGNIAWRRREVQTDAGGEGIGGEEGTREGRRRGESGWRKEKRGKDDFGS